MSASCPAELEAGIQGHRAQRGWFSRKTPMGVEQDRAGCVCGGGRSGPAWLDWGALESKSLHREVVLPEAGARLQFPTPLPSLPPTPAGEVTGKGHQVPSQLCQWLLCCPRETLGLYVLVTGQPLGNGQTSGERDPAWGPAAPSTASFHHPGPPPPMRLKALICPPPHQIKNQHQKHPQFQPLVWCQRSRSIETACGERMDTREKSGCPRSVL